MFPAIRTHRVLVPKATRWPVRLALLAVLALWGQSTLAADSETELREAIESGADDDVLAPLYLRVGDDLLRRSELSRAADAFEQALSRGSARFPAGTRLRLARHLAWAGRTDRAIAALREVLAEEPDNAEVRVTLARYLSWRGRLFEAERQADRVLALEPDNRDARLVKANAASWRGDSATAQPLYRELLAEQDDFDVRLNYTHELLASGRVVEARDSRRLLTPVEEKQRARVAHLDTRLSRFSPPRLLVGTDRYSDSDDNDRNAYALGGGISVGNIEFSAEIEEVEASDRLRSVDARRFRIAAVWPGSDGVRLRAGVGSGRVDDGESDSFFIGYLGAQGGAGNWRFDVELERDLLDETALILTNRIRRIQLDSLTTYQFDDRWRLRADLELNDYSDNNESWKLELTPQFSVVSGNPGLRVGYRRVQGGFSRQSGGGYFDPSRLEGDQLVLSGTLFGERLRGDFEVYTGQQRTERFGRRQHDTILGGSARMAYDISRHLSVEAEVEGGNFSLESPGGFNYILWNLNLIGFF